MINRLGQVPVTILGINGLLLLALLWFAIDRSFAFPAVIATTANGASKTTTASMPAAPPMLVAFRERPLFATTRKAATVEEIAAAEAAEAAADIPPPPPVLTGYRLTGTLLGAGRKVAFVQPDGNDKATSVAVGSDVEGWQLVEVDTRQAIFEREGNRTVLELVVAVGSGAAGTSEKVGGAGIQPAARELSPPNRDRPEKPSTARLYRPPKSQ